MHSFLSFVHVHGCDVTGIVQQAEVTSAVISEHNAALFLPRSHSWQTLYNDTKRLCAG